MGYSVALKKLAKRISPLMPKEWKNGMEKLKRLFTTVWTNVLTDGTRKVLRFRTQKRDPNILVIRFQTIGIICSAGQITIWLDVRKNQNHQSQPRNQVKNQNQQNHQSF